MSAQIHDHSEHDDSEHFHDHGHDHDHSHHHGHSHGTGITDERRLGWAFFIIFGFMLIEVAGGLVSGSLALLADAGHMVSDTVALGMSWVALRIGKRPADSHRSYGYRRLEVLVAFVNGCTLFAICGWIVFEAVRRFFNPVEVLGGTMLGVAIAGFLANIVVFYVLNGGNQKNLNMRSAWLHVLGDLLGFIVAIVAALIILATRWYPIDPILSIIVAVLILKNAGGIVKSSSQILLEGTPPDFDESALKNDLLAAVPALADVHHVHAWCLTNEQILVTLHASCKTGEDPMALVPAIHHRLKDKFGIGHVTVQVDPVECPDEHSNACRQSLKL